MLDGPSMEITALDQWHAWLELHAGREREIWAVILKKSTGRQLVRYEDLLEEALCWGWVDVKTKRVDDDLYGIRFVPRREDSSWTERNREIAAELIAAGRMQPEGFAKLPVHLRPQSA